VNRLIPDLIMFDILYQDYYRYRSDLDFKKTFILGYDENITIHSLKTKTNWSIFGKLAYKISQGLS